MIRRATALLVLAAIVPLTGCQTTSPNQKWPMLPEYPRPEVPKVSKVELMKAIDAMPPGEARERVKLLATELIGDLVESWRDFVHWGDRMDAVIEQYNKEAKKHNKRVD